MNNILEQFKVCMSKYADFTGRASRKEFWYFMLAHFIVLMVFGTAVDYFGDDLAAILGLYIFAVTLPSYAVGARRLHDVDRSGWLQLSLFLFMIGGPVLLFFWARKGMPETNEYGPNPLNPEDEEDEGYDLLEHLIDD